MIITDFGLRRCYGALGGVGVGTDGAEDEVEVGSEGNFDRLNAAGAGHLKLARKTAPEADVGDDFFGSAVLVNHFGAAGGRQIAHLLGLVAEIDCTRLELQIEVDRLSLEFEDFEFHGMSVKHFERAGE